MGVWISYWAVPQEAIVSQRVVGWTAFKSLIYALGYTGACWVIFWRCIHYSDYLRWAGSGDLALLCVITAGITWAIWTFGFGCIIVDGMREVKHGNENGW